jgi:hypothetical protein
MLGPFLKRTITLSALAIAVASIYGIIFSHFVPSPLGHRLALCAATLCGIGGVIWAFKLPSGYSARLGRPWFRVPVSGLLLFGFGYSAFAAGFPAWYTVAFGTPGERLVTVEKWRTPSIRSCEGPDVTETLFLQPICLSQRNAPLVPSVSKLMVRGPATAFGIKVETISRPERAAAPPPQTLQAAPVPVPPAVSDSGLPVGELVDRGRKALADKNYSEGMRLYRMAADQGEA